MTGSRIIPAIVAAFCGLALQFQPSGANAQILGTKYVDGTNVTYAPTGNSFVNGVPLCSPYWGTCLIMDGNGFIFLIDWQGNILWQPAAIGTQDCPNCVNTITPGCFSCYTSVPTSEAWLSFQPDGNLVLYANNPWVGLEHCWRTGTTNWNGDPGYYAAVGDDGSFRIYDSNWSKLWSAQDDPTYNWTEQSLIGPHFGVPCYPNYIC